MTGVPAGTNVGDVDERPPKFLEGVDLGPELPDPCYGCACCASWARSLAMLRASIEFHVTGELRVKPCDPECLVCGTVGWQSQRS